MVHVNEVICLDTRALFALCLVGILLVAFGCTGSSPSAAQPPAAVNPAQTAPAAAPSPAPLKPAPAPAAPAAETPKETAPAAPPPAAEAGFVNSKCTLNAESGDVVLLFKDAGHFKTELSKDGKLLTTMWTEGTVVYTLPAGQTAGILMEVPKAASAAAASGTPAVIPAGVKYSCVPTAVSDADVTHPAGTTFTDLSALGAG
jgi:hypothetical protein